MGLVVSGTAAGLAARVREAEGTVPTEVRQPWKTRATAFHEARHAVVMLAFGLGIAEATISPDAERDSNGHITHPPPLGYRGTGGRDQRSLVRAMILSCYAGMAAERLIDPDAPDYHGAGDADTAFYLSRASERMLMCR